MKKDFKFIELFAGIGGVSFGLEKVGGTCIMAAEYDPEREGKRQYAQEAYKLLHPHVDVVGDVADIDGTKLPEYDLLSMTFPCQPFSQSGNRRGFEDTRGTVVFEALRIANESRPKIILAENVKGIVNHDKGNTLDTIVKALNEIGYVVDFTILNSKYFGVPQNRERLFIVAIREDLIEHEPFNKEVLKGTTILPKAKRRMTDWIKSFNFDWPVEEDMGIRLKDILEKEVDDNFYLSEEATKQLTVQLEDEEKKQSPVILHNIYGGFKETKPRVFKEYSPTIRTSTGGGHIPSVLETRAVLTPNRLKKRQNGRRFKEDGEPSFTLTTQDIHGVAIKEVINRGCAMAHEGDSIAPPKLEVIGNTSRSGHDSKNIYATCGIRPTILARDFKGPVQVGIEGEIGSEWQIRKLTPLECFRLQAFEDTHFKLLEDEGFSNSQLYKFAGNAVTVNVIEAIGNKLIKYL